MKNKINVRFMSVAALAIIATVIFTTVIYYHLFQKEVMDELAGYANVMGASEDFSKDPSTFQTGNKNLRITLVAPDGTVLYDNYELAEKLDNHKDRPEVQEALEEGEGGAIRKSTTINRSNFYYAERLKNGNVLRVAKESRSIFSVYRSVFPVIMLIALVLFCFCMLLSHYLTKSLISPIEQVADNLDHLERVTTYKELMPFVNVIRTQHEDILKSAKMRQEFTANVSHELKTPLTSISGYSELIENGMATEGDIIRFAGEIHRNARRLLTLINDIINLSELDATSIDEISMEPVDLYEICQNCVNMVEPHAAKHGVSVHLSGEQKTIMANKDQMEEMVYNLCDNAIRYSKDEGNLWVTVGEQLEIKDDGIGISKENQERIFERFFRVDKSRSKKTGGTGLGLAIVKHIVELHKAQISIDSEVGKGTTITITFAEG